MTEKRKVKIQNLSLNLTDDIKITQVYPNWDPNIKIKNLFSSNRYSFFFMNHDFYPTDLEFILSGDRVVLKLPEPYMEKNISKLKSLDEIKKLFVLHYHEGLIIFTDKKVYLYRNDFYGDYKDMKGTKNIKDNLFTLYKEKGIKFLFTPSGKYQKFIVLTNNNELYYIDDKNKRKLHENIEWVFLYRPGLEKFDFYFKKFNDKNIYKSNLYRNNSDYEKVEKIIFEGYDKGFFEYNIKTNELKINIDDTKPQAFINFLTSKCIHELKRELKVIC